MRRNGEWFIRSDTGKPHMAGWMQTAIKTLPTGSRFEDPDGVWLALGICPRCYAVVITEQGHAYGDQTDAHQQWHAATDHPIPAELMEAEHA